MFAQSTIDTRLHPLQAFRAIRRLFANPEDTAQVFIVLRAMRGRSGIKLFRRFKESPVGKAVLAERRALLNALQDSKALAAMPEGSLGRTYLAFMAEENLTADGLVESSQAWGESDQLPPDALLMRERMRDMHDLTHVLTGYGRDGLGELCLLAFMHAHTRNLGQAMIVLMGMARASRGPEGPAVRAAIFQAFRNGRKARWLPGQDWEAMLPRPLEDLRREAGIVAPTRYLGVVS